MLREPNVVLKIESRTATFSTALRVIFDLKVRMLLVRSVLERDLKQGVILAVSR